ncbi:MAG: hypothetical protein QOD74_422 [Variibacter sp.]|nr:hypothetical protein [Variibacter sp.]
MSLSVSASHSGAATPHDVSRRFGDSLPRYILLPIQLPRRPRADKTLIQLREQQTKSCDAH